MLFGHHSTTLAGFIVAAVLLTGSPISAAVVNVPQDYSTLRMAVDSVKPGDTIVLDSGSYSGTGFTEIVVPDGCVIKSGHGALKTRLQGTGKGLIVNIAEPTHTSVSIEGLAFSGFDHAIDYSTYVLMKVRQCIFDGNNYGIFTMPSLMGEIHVDSCTFTNNYIAVYQFVETSAPIHDCLFRTNGYALWCDYCYHGPFADNILIDNDCALYLVGGAPEIRNNLIWRNARGVRLEDFSYSWPYFNDDFACNDVIDNTVQYWGTSDLTDTFGNFAEDPQFCDTTLANLSVSSYSPLLAANNSCHVNIGGVSTIGCYCGDVDKSGGLDIADLTLLIGYLYLGEPAPSPVETGRIDGDSLVDISDVTFLISFLFLSGPRPICS